MGQSETAIYHSEVYEGIEYTYAYPLNVTDPPLVWYNTGSGDQYRPQFFQTFLTHGYAVIQCYKNGLTGYEKWSNWTEAQTNYTTALNILVPYVLGDSFPYRDTFNHSAVVAYGWSCGGGAWLNLNYSSFRGLVASTPAYALEPAVNVYPVLIITGENDSVTPSASNGEKYYGLIGADKFFIQQKNMGHEEYANLNYTFAFYDWVINGSQSALSYVEEAGGDPFVAMANYLLVAPSPSPSPTPSPSPSPMATAVSAEPTPHATVKVIKTVSPTPAIPEVSLCAVAALMLFVVVFVVVVKKANPLSKRL
jgi:hypothetical protein